MNSVVLFQVQYGLQGKSEIARVLAAVDAADSFYIIKLQVNVYMLGFVALDGPEIKDIRSRLWSSEHARFRIHSIPLIGSCNLKREDSAETASAV